MGIEHRKSERTTPHIIQKGMLYLCANHRYFTIDNIENFSTTGVGLTVSGLINRGDKVLLRFQQNINSTPVHGYVVWSNSVGMKSSGTVTVPVSRLGVKLMN